MGGGATGINAATSNSKEAGELYDLNGRKSNSATAPGIYVKNGKKVIIK